MRRDFRRLFFLSVLLLAAGCLPGRGDALAGKGSPAVYLCGDTRVNAWFDGGSRASIQLNGAAYELATTISASGARYETAEGMRPHVVFWTKGDRYALLEIDGETMPDCHAREAGE